MNIKKQRSIKSIPLYFYILKILSLIVKEINMTDVQAKNVLLKSRDNTPLIPYIPLASSSDAGVVKIDGTSIVSNNGIISASVGTVDQTYNASSANPQSGVAIAGAGFLTSHQDISGKADKKIETIQLAPKSYPSGSGEEAIYLASDRPVWEVIPSGNLTFQFVKPSSLTIGSNEYYTFELCLKMTSTVYSMTFPNTVTWQDGETPDLSSTGTYLFAFRTIDQCTSWFGNLQGVW